MSILDFLKKKPQSKKDETSAETKVQKQKVEPKKEPPQTSSSVKGGKLYKALIVRPLISEKSVGMESERKYVFQVMKNANRTEVKRFIEQYYHVRVANVNILRTKRREHGRTKFLHIRPEIKKAIITLAKGSEIKIAK